MRVHLAFLFLFSLSVLTLQVHPQQPTESESLSAQAQALVQTKQYSEAVKIVERVIRIEKSSSPRNNKRLGTALVNLARLKRAASETERTSTSNSAIGLITLHRQHSTDGDIEEHYREALKVFDTLLPSEGSVWTTIVLEYGDLLAGEAPSYDTAEFEKIEKHYKSSIARLTDALGGESDRTLRVVLKLADLYQGASQFERAQPLYQKFIKEAEARSDATLLVAALRQYVKTLALAGQTSEAETYTRRISQITGSEEKLPNVELSGRSVENHFVAMMSDPSTITRTTKKLRTLMIDVVIDENGNVLKATAEPTLHVDIRGRNVNELAERELRSWKFRPLVLDGTRVKMYGQVAYNYFAKN